MRHVDPKFLRKLFKRNLNRTRHSLETIKKGSSMLHFIEIAVAIKTHDNASLAAAQGGGLGPVVSNKQVSFLGMGPDLDAAVAKAHHEMTEFLNSDAMRIGCEETKVIAPPLETYPPKKFVPQKVEIKKRGNDDGNGDGPGK